MGHSSARLHAQAQITFIRMGLVWGLVSRFLASQGMALFYIVITLVNQVNIYIRTKAVLDHVSLDLWREPKGRISFARFLV